VNPKLFLLALAACLPCLPAMAADRYVHTDDAVPNLARVANRIEDTLAMPVEYPALLPARDANGKLYAYAEAGRDHYTLSLDSERGCKGAHYCSVGALAVFKGRAPERLRDMSGKDITVNVHLSNGQEAFFTPGHAMGDFWPAQIQWMRNGALHSLSWNGPFPDGEQHTMMKMADSVASE
jgi:hypothetical protein